MLTIFLFGFLSLFDLQRPALTSAQSLVESGANIYAIGSVGERGAFQVREKYWGKVPKDMLSQARQAESILDSLIIECNGDTYIALQRYNGIGSAATNYAEAVIGKAIELTLLGV